MLDLTKPVQTRDGRPVRIIAAGLNLSDNKSIAGVTSRDGHRDEVMTWSTDGQYFHSRPSGLDLVNASVKRNGWVNLYRLHADPSATRPSIVRRTEAEAREHIDEVLMEGTYIATIPVAWEELP